MTPSRLYRRAIRPWVAWLSRRRLHRICPEVARIDAAIAARRKRHGRVAHLYAARQDAMTAILRER
jgi:hypothetical protein